MSRPSMLLGAFVAVACAAPGSLPEGAGDLACDEVTDPRCQRQEDNSLPRPDSSSEGSSALESERVCASINERAVATRGPVDIVVLVDTSMSMLEESEAVEQNLNGFVDSLATSGLDYRLVLIAAPKGIYSFPLPDLGLCVPQPLAGPDCGDGPRFRHVPRVVGSYEPLRLLVETLPDWRDLLRTDATLHVLVVTDEDARWNGPRSGTPIPRSEESVEQTLSAFRAAWGNAAPRLARSCVFHSIASFEGMPVGCDGGGELGQVYAALSAQTGGKTASVCADDWQAVFGELAQGVHEQTQATCTHALPTPREGQLLFIPDTEVRLLGTDASDVTGVVGVPSVANADACADRPGWYLAPQDAPQKLSLCPATCAALAAGTVEAEIRFGCRPVVR